MVTRGASGFPSLGTGENFLAQTDLTLPKAGPVFVTAASNAVNVSCNPAGATATALGVVIDSTVVPGTTRDGTSDVNAPFNVSGVSASLSAGAHTAWIAGSCAGTSTSDGMSTITPSVSIILLGAG